VKMLHITQVEYAGEYTINVVFNDGRAGKADLSAILDKGVFQSLKDVALFSQAHVDDELETIAWPNGLDLAPEFVYFCAFKGDALLQPQFKAWGYAA